MADAAPDIRPGDIWQARYPRGTARRVRVGTVVPGARWLTVYPATYAYGRRRASQPEVATFTTRYFLVERDGKPVTRAEGGSEVDLTLPPEESEGGLGDA